jgi:predicted lipoprotein with Yx(FWY)xxD motif
MKRTIVLLVSIGLATAGVAAGMALGGGSKSVTVKSAYVRALKRSALVTSAGLTLYRNKTEKNGHIRCTGACASAWPPLLVPTGDRLSAGPGVAQAKLGTTRRPDGKRQATYGGSPLYRFASDSKAGDAKGQGVGGVWLAAGASGPSAPATTAPATTAPATTTTSTTPTDTGYSY